LQLYPGSEEHDTIARQKGNLLYTVDVQPTILCSMLGVYGSFPTLARKMGIPMPVQEPGDEANPVVEDYCNCDQLHCVCE